MMLSAVDLHAESWQLARVMIALLQPLLVMLLIAGLVVATAHLLTMIGTRWGDRQASSKAMFFSVGVHLLLACGLVALIPEYRAHVFARLSELDDVPIRILMTPERTDAPDAEGPDGNTPLFDRLLDTQPPQWSRMNAPPDLASQITPLEKPSESPSFTPERIPDKTLPAEPLPAPQQETTSERGQLQQAVTQMQAESLPTQLKPEATVPSSSRERSEAPSAKTTDPLAISRPDLGSVDRLKTVNTPDRQAPDLTDAPSPEAALMRSNDQDLSRREGPVPASPVPELLGQQPKDSSSTTRSGAPVKPQLARTESRMAVPPAETTGIGRMRPRVAPSAPDIAELRRENAVVGRDAGMPLPVEQPQLSRMDDPFLRRTDQDRVPSAYRLRTEEERDRAIMKFGGSAETEEAVDLSLKWLASVQNPAGYWDASEFGAGQVGRDEEGIDRKFAGREADTGVTALAVLAFLGKLNTVDQGEYSPVVNRALRWLVSQQSVRRWSEEWGETDGYLGGKASDFEGMYCHAMATFALGEAYAMSRDNPDALWLRRPLEKAVSFILETQNPDGGWRYVKGQHEGDMSIFGWQLMALKSAEAAGISISPRHKEQMRKFLYDRRLGRYGGLAGYRLNEPPTTTMTAEALYCRQMLGLADNEDANQEATQLLLANRPQRTALNLYYWYYGTLAMYQRGGPAWDEWNLAVRDLLVSEQRRTGPLAGSWDPRDVWGRYGGRIYSTAIATLSLEVYYRYLPLYRLHEN